MFSSDEESFTSESECDLDELLAEAKDYAEHHDRHKRRRRAYEQEVENYHLQIADYIASIELRVGKSMKKLPCFALIVPPEDRGEMAEKLLNIGLTNAVCKESVNKYGRNEFHLPLNAANELRRLGFRNVDEIEGQIRWLKEK